MPATLISFPFILPFDIVFRCRVAAKSLLIYRRFASLFAFQLRLRSPAASLVSTSSPLGINARRRQV